MPPTMSGTSSVIIYLLFQVRICHIGCSRLWLRMLKDPHTEYRQQVMALKTNLQQIAKCCKNLKTKIHGPRETRIAVARHGVPVCHEHTLCLQNH